jgi:hypothetical protein
LKPLEGVLNKTCAVKKLRTPNEDQITHLWSYTKKMSILNWMVRCLNVMETMDGGIKMWVSLTWWKIKHYYKKIVVGWRVVKWVMC